MKYKWIIALLIALTTGQAQAQTWGEWFSQKKTQKKYLLEQIAALKVYTGYLQKGYQVAKTGLSVIGDLKSGELSLHRDYFSSLELVSPRIKKYERIAQIIRMNIQLVTSVAKLRAGLRSGRWLSGQELEYTGQVLDRLIGGCTAALDELLAVISDGQLQMKDDQRIARIDQLYVDMTSNQLFYRQFSREALALQAARRQQQAEASVSKQLFNLQ